MKSTLKVKGYDQQLTVIAVQMSDGAGASAAASGAGGLPEVSLTTDRSRHAGLRGRAPTPASATRAHAGLQPGAARHEDLDTARGDTFWSQYQGATTGPLGEVVTLADTAPSGDHWNMAAVEVLGDGDES